MLSVTYLFMRTIYITAFLLILTSQFSKGQTTLNFTIKQLPALNVSAGIDTLVKKGDKVQLISNASGGSGTYPMEKPQLLANDIILFYEKSF
jgi:hypothetical protein